MRNIYPDIPLILCFLFAFLFLIFALFFWQSALHYLDTYRPSIRKTAWLAVASLVAAVAFLLFGLYLMSS